MENKSSIEYAYDVLKEAFDRKQKSEPVPFGEILQEVGNRMNITDVDSLIKMASRFYTDLILDGRFVIKENNTWVLREHELYDNVHIDMNEVYSLENMQDEEEQPKAKTDDGDEEDEATVSEEEPDEDNYKDETEEGESEEDEEKISSSDEDEE